jgi:hypothetical protein
MIKIFFVLINLSLIVMLLEGCTGTGFSGRVENDYGNSHRLAIANQTLNPEAEKNLAPVYGISGNTADTIVDSFQETFEQRLRPPNFPLDLLEVSGN